MHELIVFLANKGLDADASVYSAVRFVGLQANRPTHRLGGVEAFGHQRTRPALSQKWQRCTPRTSIDGSIVGRC